MGIWISFVGMAVILGIAVLLSTNRRAINLRVVGAAFALQAGVAAFVLYLPFGKQLIQSLSDAVWTVIGYSGAGIRMVFGQLATDYENLSFAINVLPVIIFFASLMAVAYHVGIMQWVVRLVGGALRRIIGTQSVESLNAAANIFVGQTEAPLVVRPYLRGLTEPQFFAIMVSGLASVAGTVLFAYASMGAKLEYLLAASFMAAPGGLLMAKLIIPDEPGEREEPGETPELESGTSHYENVIMAAAVGAQDGLKLAVNIAAMLLAFVALIAMFNGFVGWLGGLVGVQALTLQDMLGWIFGPLMFLLSVPWEEAQVAGALFGEKLILNEFVAFLHYQELVEGLSPRAQAVITFSLCGFANLSSIAILLGGLGSLVPEKRDLIARFGLRAVAAGSLSNLMSAALASVLIGL